MKVLKWILVVILSAGLLVTASTTGIFFAIDRSFGSTDFMSGLVQRVDIASIANVALKKNDGESVSSELGLLGKAGFGLIEPEFKRQAKPMLDQLYAYLKGKTQEPKLVMSLGDFKKSPEILRSAVDSMMANETMKKVPRYVLEPAAKLLIERLPDELSFSKLLVSHKADLEQVRDSVGRFYNLYALAAGLSLLSVIIIALLLRNTRQILVTLGVVLVLASLALFLPVLISDALAANMVAGYKGVAADSVKAISLTFLRGFFAVLVASPIYLGIAGLVSLAAGVFAYKKTAA